MGVRPGLLAVRVAAIARAGRARRRSGRLPEHTQEAEPVIAEISASCAAAVALHLVDELVLAVGGHDMSPYHDLGPRLGPRRAVLRRIPALRQLVTWNCVIRVRRR